MKKGNWYLQLTDLVYEDNDELTLQRHASWSSKEANYQWDAIVAEERMVPKIGLTFNSWKYWLSSRNFFEGGGGKIYCYANFFCYANFSILFGPNFGGLLQGVPPAPSLEESQNSGSEIMYNSDGIAKEFNCMKQLLKTFWIELYPRILGVNNKRQRHKQVVACNRPAYVAISTLVYCIGFGIQAQCN